MFLWYFFHPTPNLGLTRFFLSQEILTVLRNSLVYRSRLYSDEPPSYDQVTSDSQVCGPSPLQDTPTPTGVSSATTLHRCEGTDNIEYVNDEDDVFYIREGDDDLQPPPHYEDFMRASECIRTTRL